MYKICSKCKIKKPISDYYFYNTRGYYLAKCKQCSKKESKETIYRNRKIEGTYAWWNRKHCGVKGGAISRNLSFQLTLSDYKKLRTDWKCFYCGSKNTFSVDRANNKLGYTKKNSIACCLRCNRAKSYVFSKKEMIILGEALQKIDKLRGKQIRLRIFNPK